MPQRPRGEEDWAVRMVVRALRDATVTHHDDGSQPGMFDVSITYSDGSIAAMEITSAADPEATELWNIVNGTDERWVIPDLTGGWTISLLPDARAKRVRAELPSLLIACESQNTAELQPGWTRRPDRLTALADDLGVAHARNGPTRYPGWVSLRIEQPRERTSGAASPRALLDWIPAFLSEAAQADVLRKLDESGHAERHVFVFLPAFATAPFGVRDLLWQETSGLPAEPPVLPREVTHFWIVTTSSMGTGIRWEPGSGWSRFDSLLNTDN